MGHGGSPSRFASGIADGCLGPEINSNKSKIGEEGGGGDRKKWNEKSDGKLKFDLPNPFD